MNHKNYFFVPTGNAVGEEKGQNRPVTYRRVDSSEAMLKLIVL